MTIPRRSENPRTLGKEPPVTDRSDARLEATKDAGDVGDAGRGILQRIKVYVCGIYIYYMCMYIF